MMIKFRRYCTTDTKGLYTQKLVWVPGQSQPRPGTYTNFCMTIVSMLLHGSWAVEVFLYPVWHCQRAF